jgi:hypothetical protein
MAQNITSRSISKLKKEAYVGVDVYINVLVKLLFILSSMR